VQLKLSPLIGLLSLSKPLHLAKASFWQLLYPSVKTHGNKVKKGYSLPSLLRDGQEAERSAALAKISRLATT
jgi:hypothetical protein